MTVDDGPDGHAFTALNGGLGSTFNVSPPPHSPVDVRPAGRAAPSSVERFAQAKGGNTPFGSLRWSSSDPTAAVPLLRLDGAPRR